MVGDKIAPSGAISILKHRFLIPPWVSIQNSEIKKIFIENTTKKLQEILYPPPVPIFYRKIDSEIILNFLGFLFDF